MNRTIRMIQLTSFLSLLLAAVFLFSACGDGTSSSGDGEKEIVTEFEEPTAAGETVYGKGDVSIDASNTADGYIMAEYSGPAEKAVAQVTIPEGTVYTYPIIGSGYKTLPLTGGDGTYHIDLLELVGGNNYALLFSKDIKVALNNEFTPFLYPNEYVNYTNSCDTAALGRKIAAKSSDNLDYIAEVYEYVIKHVSYDNAKAATVETGYVPNPDDTLNTGKGICFDFASLMTALLRSQNIPARLEVGYSGDVYHAWISAYVSEIGWVDSIIEFDGVDWTLMDPTMAAESSKSQVKEYLSDKSHYILKYSY